MQNARRSSSQDLPCEQTLHLLDAVIFLLYAEFQKCGGKVQP